MEEAKGVPESRTSAEVPAEEVDGTAGGGRDLEEERFLLLYERFLLKASHCSTDQFLHKSQVLVEEQSVPLHLAHVGWGSRSKDDMKAPHFFPPTPGHKRFSRDITKRKRWKKLS